MDFTFLPWALGLLLVFSGVGLGLARRKDQDNAFLGFAIAVAVELIGVLLVVAFGSSNYALICDTTTNQCLGSGQTDLSLVGFAVFLNIFGTFNLRSS